MALTNDGRIKGVLNYETSHNGDRLVIEELFSLTENGFYFSWSMENCGFGQYSIYYNEETEIWFIDNERMGLNSSSALVGALEEAIRKENNPDANYCLEKLINKIYKGCSSLKEGLVMIWLEGTKSDKEFDERNEKANDFKESVSLGDLVIKDCAFDVYNPTKQYPEHERYSFILKYDYLNKHFGQCFISYLSLGSEYFFEVSINFDKEKFNDLFSLIEKIGEVDLSTTYNKEQIENILKIKSNWDSFKKIMFEKKNIFNVEHIFSSKHLREYDYAKVSK